MSDKIITCQACGAQISANKNFCTQCGYSFKKMKEAQNVLDTDPELVQINEKYAKKRLTKRVWTITFWIALLIAYLWLEHGWFEEFLDFLPLLAIFAMPISLVVIAVLSISISRLRKRIENGLEDKVGTYHLDIDTNGEKNNNP